MQVSPGGPYLISYRSIRPKAEQCTNLLVPVCCRCSHIAYGSIRMEPVFMVLGQSAATAACLAIDDKVDVQKVPTTKLRQRLLADKQVLELKGRPEGGRPATVGAGVRAKISPSPSGRGAGGEGGLLSVSHFRFTRRAPLLTRVPRGYDYIPRGDRFAHDPNQPPERDKEIGRRTASGRIRRQVGFFPGETDLTYLARGAVVLFGRGQLKGWTNKLNWGDNKLISATTR